jgi:fructokinase
VITQGAQGATWVDQRRSVDVASLPVAVADTIGAGDTFAAAIIDALLDRGPLGELSIDDVTDVLGHAAGAAAVTVSRPGADPPHRWELD